MIVTLVHIWVKEAYIADFLEASRLNRENSLKEKGNIRFDLLQENQNPAKFIFYEAFKDEQSVAYHKTTSHYLRWRDTVADWMTQPREGVRFNYLG
jgi:(4S)-4-hydroxy-5-phosphonooxypentane-2,3-dione isomerase